MRLDCLLFIRICILQDYPERHYLRYGYGKDTSEGSDLIDKWSTCSVEDFKAHYQMFTNIDGSYCLENRIVDDREGEENVSDQYSDKFLRRILQCPSFQCVMVWMALLS